METGPTENAPGTAVVEDAVGAPPPPYVPRRRAGGQIITFLLGGVVGACLCYGFLSATGIALPNPSLVPAAPPGSPAIPIPEIRNDELADINGLWPARHLVMVLGETKLSQETLELYGSFKPGAVLIPPKLLDDPAEMQEVTSAIRRAVGRDGLPVFIAADMGNPNPLASGPPPAYFSLGAVGEPATATEAGAAYGLAARERGFDAVMAPWTSVAISGQAAPETAWTADAAQSASLANAYADGMQSEGVIPIALAFPGMSLAKPKGGRQFVIEEQELRLIASNMVPLREVAAAGIPGMLATHTAVPILDKNFPDRPASISPTLINGVLRDKWRYEGVVIADDLAPLAAALNKPVEELFVQSLSAGCDAMILSGADRTTLRRICAALVALVDAGGVDPTSLDDSKIRLSGWQEARRAFEQRAQQPGPSPQPDQTVLLRHTVQPGETLIAIGRLHNVKVTDLKAWNGLVDSSLSQGQRLNIYLPRAEGAEPPVEEADTEEEALEDISEDSDAAEVEETAAPDTANTIEFIQETAPVEIPELVESEAPKEEPMEEPKATRVEPLPAAMTESAPEEEKPAPVKEPQAEVTPPVEEVEPAAPVAEPEPAPEEAKPSPLVPAEVTEEAAPAPPVETAAPTPPPALKLGKYHVWTESDTIENVANTYGITVKQIQDWNLFDVAPPSPGMEVVVVAPQGLPDKKDSAPVDDSSVTTYAVKAGDTLHKIALQHATTKNKLVELNGLKSADHIVPGQKLKVPKAN